MTEKEKPEEDFLSVDIPIPGQNFACLSFVSPEKELANKDMFMVHHFLKSVAKDYNLSPESVTEKYNDYLYNNNERLEKEFYEENDFKCTVRGIKIRGTYDTEREANVRAKLLQRKDPNFHVYVGQVGYWLPWDPNADGVETQEYQDGQLNKLVKKYQENTKKRDIFYETEKKESIEKIKQDQSNARKESNESSETTVESESNEKSNTDDTVDNTSSDLLKNLSEKDPWLKNKENNTIDLDTIL